MRRPCRLLSIVVAGLLGSAPALADEPAAETGLKIGGLPIVDYTTDEGFGFGGRFKITDFGDGTHHPFLWSLEFQGFVSTRGIQSHYVSLDLPNMGGSPYRLQVGLAYGRSKYAPYYGVGNGSRYQEARTQCPRDTLEQLVGAGHPPDTCPPSGTDPGNPAFTGYRYYDYDVTNFPTAHLTLFRALSGPWSLFGGYQFVLFTVRPLYHPDLEELGQTTGSQLISDGQAGRLVGYDGQDFSAEQRIRQRYSELSFGVRFDTRDNEFAPTRGMLHDLSVRGAAHPLGSESTVWGANANLRLYQRPIPSYWRLVLALRLVGDVTSSGAPFYLLSSMGPTAPDGLGGSSSIRGLLLHRFVGDVKVLGNAELRWRFLSLGPFEVGAVGGIDAGRVWAQLGKADVGPVHVGAAAGLRIAWSHHFVIRADYGFGISEPYADGSIYLDFGELF